MTAHIPRITKHSRQLFLSAVPLFTYFFLDTIIAAPDKAIMQIAIPAVLPVFAELSEPLAVPDDLPTEFLLPASDDLFPP